MDDGSMSPQWFTEALKMGDWIALAFREPRNGGNESNTGSVNWIQGFKDEETGWTVSFNNLGGEVNKVNFWLKQEL